MSSTEAGKATVSKPTLTTQKSTKVVSKPPVIMSKPTLTTKE